MESVLRQGLTILTWSSLTLDNFFQEVDEVMKMFNQLLKKVNIFSSVKDIGLTMLFILCHLEKSSMTNFLLVYLL